jgi:hypothetical protein
MALKIIYRSVSSIYSVHLYFITGMYSFICIIQFVNLLQPFNQLVVLCIFIGDADA